MRELPYLVLSVSVTTRPPRPGDVEGESYHFVTDEEFDELIRSQSLCEWAQVYGHRYGTLTERVTETLAAGQDLILEIDYQGFDQIAGHFEDVLSIFIAPPSLEELRRRLERRGTETIESIERRLQAAQVEMEAMQRYTVVIVNDDQKKATEELVSVLKKKSS